MVDCIHGALKCLLGPQAEGKKESLALVQYTKLCLGASQGRRSPKRHPSNTCPFAHDHLSRPELRSRTAKSFLSANTSGAGKQSDHQNLQKPDSEPTQKAAPFTMLPVPALHPARRADAAGAGPLLPGATRAAVAEFVATAIFVFAAEGSVYGLCTPS